MSKVMSVQDYLKLTNSDKLEIERLLFETVKEEMENQFSFLKVEEIMSASSSVSLYKVTDSNRTEKVRVKIL